MATITPFLWFDDRLEAAVALYTRVFPDAKVLSVSRNGAKVTSMTFVLQGQEFMALNGGPHFQFTPAVSFFVKCETQAEIDHYWTALTAQGGEESRCGWLKDPYGLSWQIVPGVLGRYLSDPDPSRAQRVGAAMMNMRKIDIAALDAAHAG